MSAIVINRTAVALVAVITNVDIINAKNRTGRRGRNDSNLLHASESHRRSAMRILQGEDESIVILLHLI